MPSVLKYVFSMVALALMSSSAGAQFYAGNNEPASRKWMSIKTEAFEVVYPAGFDSLATVYIKELEKYRIPVGRSLRLTGGQFHSKPLPVILHTNNMQSNGEVTWTPKRMELQTLPQWSGASAVPWVTMLAIHEGRHYAQMQFGYRNVFKPFRWFLGEIVPGAAAIYPGKLLLEGDAVVAETALTDAGRGREPNFLMYYNVAYENGDRRRWPQWANGSFYRYTPDHYAFGYLILSGMRTMYDRPFYMADYFDYVSRRPYNPIPMKTAMRRTSGVRYRQAYADVMDFQYRTWAKGLQQRPHDMPSVPITAPERFTTVYCSPNVGSDGQQLWVKEDLFHNKFLTSIDSTGRQRRLCPVGDMIDKINHEETDSVLIWSELRKDPRWGQMVGTVIRTYNTYTHRRSKISHSGHYIYPIKVGEDICAIDLRECCCTDIVRIDVKDRHVKQRIHFKSSVQPTEITHLGDTLYVMGISDKGYGIYRIDEGRLVAVFDPVPVQMSSLEHDGDCLTFESGHDGSWELFRYNPHTRVMTQLTGSRYGAYDYNLCESGDVLWSQPSPEGTRAVLTRKDQLLDRQVDPREYFRYEIADSLSAQERRIEDSGASSADRLNVSRPGKWFKFPHAFNLHSWAPVYVDVNSVADLSFENVRNSASLGAMAMFQSVMNSFSGYAGYQAKPDSRGTWHHSGHINFKYSGLYPVIEASLHFNERAAFDYKYNASRDTLFYKNSDRAMVRGTLGGYVPLSWYDECALYGVVPRFGVNFNNDLLEGKGISNLYVGARGYVMSRTPSACVYPKWGIGVEMMYYDPVLYCYVYGYVPSFFGQGLKLTALGQRKVNPAKPFYSSYAVIIPRGVDREYASSLTEGMKVTADYAIPFPVGDWCIGDGFHCKRGILTPHFDASWFKAGTLTSAGATFELEFGAFCWVNTPITLGVTYSRNGGTLLQKYPDKFKKDHVEMVFNIALP